MNNFFSSFKNIIILLLCFLLISILIALTLLVGNVNIDKAVINLSNKDGSKKCIPAQWLDPASGDNGFFGFYCSYSLCTSFQVIKTVKVSCRVTDYLMKNNNKQLSEEEYPYWSKQGWLPNRE